jgi:hypothetical protein
MRRHPVSRVLVVVLAVFLLGGVGATPAHAEDPLPPPIVPPGVTTPPDGDNEVPPGPTYVITPGSEGTELGEPADQAEIDEAKKASGTAPGTKKIPSAGPTRTPGVTVAGPEAPAQAPTAQGDPVSTGPLGPWWAVGAGALLLLVLVELGRAATRRGAVRVE